MPDWDARQLGIALGALLIAVVLVALGALYVVQRDRVLPNTSVAGVDVGGLTADEARATLVPLVDVRHNDDVEFTFENARYALPARDVAYQIDLDASVTRALHRGRTGLPGELATRIRSLRTPERLPLADSYDRARLTSWIEELAAEIDREHFPGRVEPDPETLAVSVELPHGRAIVQRDAAVEEAHTLLTGSQNGPVDLPVETEPQRVTNAAVERVAAQVERALEQPVELSAGDEVLTFSPSELATFIRVEERIEREAATVELTVDAEIVDDLTGDDHDRFATEPVDAEFVTSRTPPATLDNRGSTSFSPVATDIEVEPARDGARFERDLLVGQLTEMLRAGEHTADLALERTEPELTTELAEEFVPTHLLGTFTTYHPAGQDRVVNIQKLADTIDDAVLLPGEQFSINGISGPRSCAKGYRPAGTIVAGELTDTCGGGTSQLGTTTFNAAFFSGLQLDQWKAHSWYFDRYPQGREATLDYPALDVTFTNTSDGVAILRTTYTSGAITVSIYGQPVAKKVTARHSGPFAFRDFSEQTRETNERCEGTEVRVQSGADGYSVDVTRAITWVDGASEDQNIRTVYSPRHVITEVGTRDCTPEPDEPDETDETDETEDPAPDDDADADDA